MTNQAFCLKRSNHLNTMIDDLEKMLKDESMVDVSLSCEDGIIKAHKIILSACSMYFRQVFSKVQLNNQYPIIIIKDMPYQDLKYIIDFIYRGEVLIPEDHLNSVLKSAEALKIKGLTDAKNSQRNENLVTPNKTLSDEHVSNRKKKKKKRKTTHSSILNQDQDKNKEQNKQKNLISSEDVSDEYTDEDEIHSHNQSLNNTLSHQFSHHSHLLQSVHNSPALNETEIEPSRLLEQSMITGDAQNISNLQSLSQNSSQNKYPQYLLSSVKQMMYDDSSGLISGQLLTNDQTSISSNHNLLTQFEESSSLAGPSNISLLSRQNEGISGLNDDLPFHNDQLINTSHNNTILNSANALSQLNITQQVNNISGGEIIINEDGTNKPKRTYQCNYCLKRFDIRYSLQRHLKVIHDPLRKLYQCQICNKKFVWKSAYCRHVNVTCARQRKGT